MPALQFEQVVPVGGEATLRHWQHIHNLIIPTAPLSVDEIAVRAQHYHLEVAYHDGAAVGCSTMRPPTRDPATPDTATPDTATATATVIARVLPEHRRHGFGEQIYQRALTKARELGANIIETVVLASNGDGLRFAIRHGFVEVERYVLPGDDIPFVDLRLT